MARFLAATGVLAAVAGFSVLGGGPGAPMAHASPRPGCSTSIAYLAEGIPTVLSALTFGAGSVTVTPIGASGVGYNAMGRNPADGYLYAVESSPASGDLLRIDPGTAAITDLGATNPPLLGTTWNSGTFGPSGRFYVNQSGTRAMRVIDVSTLTTTTLMLSAATEASDLTEGPGGFFWGATGSAAPSGRLVRVDPATGQTTFFPAPAGMLASALYPAAFTYGNGDLGLGYGGGELYQVAITNPASSAPLASLLSAQTVPPASTGDATSCSSPPTDLAVTKSGPAQIAPGAAVSWQITVTNNGPAVSSGFSVRDPVPSGFSAVTAGLGCSVSGQVVTCTGGALAVGDASTVSVSARAPATDQCVANTATVTGNEAEPAGTTAAADNSASAHTCVVSPASLTVVNRWTSTTDRNGNGLLEAGDIVRYAVQVTNIGTVALTDVQARDLLAAPAGPPLVLNCPPGSPPSTLAAGATFTCSAIYRLTQADIDAGHDLVSTAHASALSPSNAVIVAAPSTVRTSITVRSSVALLPTGKPAGSAVVGGQISWQLLVTNTGTTTVHDLEIASAGGDIVSCPARTLAPGQDEICTVTSPPFSAADVRAATFTDAVSFVAVSVGSRLRTGQTEVITFGASGAGVLATTASIDAGSWLLASGALMLLGLACLALDYQLGASSRPRAHTGRALAPRRCVAR